MVDYAHGQRITPEVWELSALDQSIQQYENRCKNHFYKNKKVPGETKSQRTDRLKELKDAKALLDLERNRIMSMISVEGQLQAYRDEHKHLKERDRIQKYKEEDHHPTDQLETNLRLGGRAQPSLRFTAHHVVEGVGKLDEITRKARMKLFTANIRINDPDNGVWMPRASCDEGHWSMPKCIAHSKIHTHNYERWIWGQLQPLEFENEIRAKLGVIRGLIKTGAMPSKVTEKPDKSWSGRK